MWPSYGLQLASPALENDLNCYNVFIYLAVFCDSKQRTTAKFDKSGHLAQGRIKVQASRAAAWGTNL
jgi:hypothetical protein